MKKLVAMLLVIAAVLSLAACTGNSTTTSSAKPSEPKAEGVMTYAEYAAAALDSKVTIEAYVQATQNWYDGKITVYTQDKDGGYFLYEMPCTEEEAAKLVPGTKIRVTGTKIAWAGEVEISDIEKFEILDGTYVAEPQDLTEILANEAALLKKQNVLAAFKNLTIEGISYKNGEPGDDIYVTVSQNGKYFDFCVEKYLTGPDTDVYKAFADLKAGDTVNIEGFVYWYYGVNTHITAVEKLDSETKGEGVMTYAEYIAAPLETLVTVEAYVQATQNWYQEHITVYAQDRDGAYFLYEMPCTEEEAAKLVPGTKIRVTGYKIEWSGEVEIKDFESVEILDEGCFIARPKDLTSILGNDEELIKHQNELAIFKGLTVKEISYKNGEPGDDIYVTVALDGKDYSFCVERYLTGPESDVYKAFTEETIKAGDKVDIEAFVYWYKGVNPHVTGISKVKAEA